MKVFIGADHRGYTLKEEIKPWLEEQGYEVHDVGSYAHDPEDDYPKYAAAVGEQVSSSSDSLGIVMCGSGVGVDIAANKIQGVRAGFGASVAVITSARRDDNINVLAVPADFAEIEEVKQRVDAFLKTTYTPNERFERRIEEINKLEKKEE
jgi:ribose 5-phosphate isomerase B